MASAAVLAAIRARLTANWTATPVIYPNESSATPGDAAAFLTVQFPVALGDQITVGAPGNNVFRDSGAIRFVLAVPIGSGLEQGLAWIDQLRTLFRSVKFASVTTYAPSPAVENNANDDGNYWVLSFSVPFYADIFA